ncbi:MAG: RNA polymerase sigma factor, partial [Chitinophagales bacterium]
LAALYLLFNEGYHSSSYEKVIRKDLITEATRLCFLLTENETTNLGSVKALLALMLFHSARLESRLDKEDHILLLEQQDRLLWDRELINAGTVYFESAMEGDSMSWYHLQAALAFQHVSASSFETTDWSTILELYDLLCRRYPSPVAFLNRAIAISYVRGIPAAIEAVYAIPEKEKLSEYYLFPATLGELHFRKKDFAQAKKYFHDAMALTHSPAEKKLLQEKISRCEES